MVLASDLGSISEERQPGRTAAQVRVRVRVRVRDKDRDRDRDRDRVRVRDRLGSNPKTTSPAAPPRRHSPRAA